LALSGNPPYSHGGCDIEHSKSDPSQSSHFESKRMMLGIYLGIWLVAIVVLFIVIRNYTKKRNGVLQTFASQHNVTYVARPDASTVIEPKLVNALRGVYDQMLDPSNNSTFFCDSGADPGSGASGQSTIRFLGIRRLVSGQTSFVLAPNDGATMRFFGTTSLKQVSFESDDLNKVFQLMAQPGQEVNTLQTLPPDVLLWLAQHAPNATVVLRPGSLYVFMLSRIAITGAAGESDYESQYKSINAIGDYVTSHLPK
jgi:hypothetical protein